MDLFSSVYLFVPLTVISYMRLSLFARCMKRGPLSFCLAMAAVCDTHLYNEIINHNGYKSKKSATKGNNEESCAIKQDAARRSKTVFHANNFTVQKTVAMEEGSIR